MPKRSLRYHMPVIFDIKNSFLVNIEARCKSSDIFVLLLFSILAVFNVISRKDKFCKSGGHDFVRFNMNKKLTQTNLVVRTLKR